ncbi:MAG: hypothetical protein Q9218_004668 [Villophora microphyllina]
MEHLHVPTDAVIPSIEIPYLEGEAYDHQGYFDFPKRKGYKTLNTGYVVEENANLALLAFYQSWLYFGLIATVLELQVNTDHFLRPSLQTDARVVDTSRLRPLIDSWLERLHKSPKDSAKSALKSAKQHLLFAQSQCNILESYGVQKPLIWPDIILSIRVLIGSLYPAIVVNDSGIRKWTTQSLSPIRSPASKSAVPSASSITTHMQINGWCPYRVHHLTSLYQYNTLYYVACLPKRRGRVRNHDSCLDAGMCFGDSVDSSKPFVCQHTRDCDLLHCQPRAAPMEKIIPIIEQGGVPLIKCVRKGHEIVLDVIKAKHNTDYTAITHVWYASSPDFPSVSAPGQVFGNGEDTSITECQLRRLIRQLEALPRTSSRTARVLKSTVSRAKMALGLPTHVLFWLDVLCIPVQQQHAHLRAAAISRMTPTYAGARRVLVLDSELQELSYAKTSTLELSARLLRSAWMGRSWTLQEASLAEDLIFQLADRHIQLETLQRDVANLLKKTLLPTENYTDYNDILFQVVMVLNFSLTGKSTMKWTTESFSSSYIKRDFQFCLVWNEFLGRSTTKMDDIHCVMANMLDFNAGEILKLPPELRMKVMLCAQSRLPQTLLFGDMPRLTTNDILDRWVPKYAGTCKMELPGREQRFIDVKPGIGLFVQPAQLIQYRLPGHAVCHSTFCLIDSVSGWMLWVKVHSAATIYRTDDDDSGILILEHYKSQAQGQYPEAEGLIGRGAILSSANFEDSCTTAIYESSVTFGHWHMADTRTGAEDYFTTIGQRITDQKPVIIRTGRSELR